MTTGTKNGTENGPENGTDNGTENGTENVARHVTENGTKHVNKMISECHDILDDTDNLKDSELCKEIITDIVLNLRKYDHNETPDFPQTLLKMIEKTDLNNSNIIHLSGEHFSNISSIKLRRI